MKILIVSPFFAPNNLVGALRPTKIADFLTQKGHTVDVVTAGGAMDASYAVPQGLRTVYTMRDYYEEAPKGQAGSSSEGFLRRLKKKIPRRAMDYYYQYLESADKSFYRYFKKLYKSTLQYNGYDVVITSYSPIPALHCGLYMKKKSPSVKWVCDFRDPVVVTGTLWPFRRSRARLQRKSCKNADAVLSVSKGCLRKICDGKHQEKSYVLPNGYDKKDMAKNPPLESASGENKLSFAYAGSLYMGQRDVSVIFKALAALKEEGKIDLSRVCFKYAGSEFVALQRQASPYGCEEVIENHGRLSRAACLQFQSEADLLVLATWNTKQEQGVFTGKFLEYMLMQKPVVSVTVGEVPGSEVSEVIAEGNLGVAYEAACDEIDFVMLKDYIEKAYLAVVNGGKVDFAPSEEVVARYSWDNLIDTLDDIIKK